MRVSFNPNIQQQNFTAVNEKFLKEAKWQINKINDVTGDLVQRIAMEVIFAEKMTPQDAIDTYKAINKANGKTDIYVQQYIEFFEDYKAGKISQKPCLGLRNLLRQGLHQLWNQLVQKLNR